MAAKRMRFNDMYAEAVSSAHASLAREGGAELKSMAEVVTVQVAKTAMEKAPGAVLRAVRQMSRSDRALMVAGLLMQVHEAEEMDDVMAHLPPKRQRALAFDAINSVKRQHPDILTRDDLVVFYTPQAHTSIARPAHALPHVLFESLRFLYAAHHDPNREERLPVMHDGSLGLTIYLEDHELGQCGNASVYPSVCRVASQQVFGDEDADAEAQQDDYELNNEVYDVVQQNLGEISNYLEEELIESWHEDWEAGAVMQGMAMSRAPAITVMIMP